MAEYKNQHYVPQFLLRGWTDDEKVYTYHIENQEEYPKTPISNLCSDDYFYGGPEIEKSLGPLEARHSRIINDLRDTKSFSTLSDNDIRFFCVFILLQRNRTKQTKKEIEESIDSLAKEVIRTRIEEGDAENETIGDKTILEHLDDVKIKQEKPLAQPILMALTGIDQILDLEPVILNNTTEKGFIISDHPVVHDNRRFKSEVDRYLVGIQSKGLQMFVPLSDDVQIMLYDPSSYFVDYSDEQARRVDIDSETVVESLNDLQLINAFDAVFYRESGREEEFDASIECLSSDIEAGATKFQRLEPDEHPFDTDNEILEMGQLEHDYSPVLPFVMQRREAEFDVMRNPEVYKQHKNYLSDLLENAREQSDSDESFIP